MAQRGATAGWCNTSRALGTAVACLAGTMVMGAAMVAAGATLLTPPWSMVWFLIGIMAAATWLSGVCALCVHGVTQLKRRPAQGRKPHLPATAVAVLYAVVLCAGYWAVTWIPSAQSRYVVVVTNESSSPVEQIRIIGPGQTLEIGSVTPGQEERAVLAIDRDGDLTLEGVFRNREVAMSIAGYVTPGQGGSRRVTIRPDGRFVLGE